MESPVKGWIKGLFRDWDEQLRAANRRTVNARPGSLPIPDIIMQRKKRRRPEYSGSISAIDGTERLGREVCLRVFSFGWFRTDLNKKFVHFPPSRAVDETK
jgi:hypothetical protein